MLSLYFFSSTCKMKKQETKPNFNDCQICQYMMLLHWKCAPAIISYCQCIYHQDMLISLSSCPTPHPKRRNIHTVWQTKVFPIQRGHLLKLPNTCICTHPYTCICTHPSCIHVYTHAPTHTDVHSTHPHTCMYTHPYTDTFSLCTGQWKLH